MRNVGTFGTIDPAASFEQRGRKVRLKAHSAATALAPAENAGSHVLRKSRIVPSLSKTTRPSLSAAATGCDEWYPGIVRRAAVEILVKQRREVVRMVRTREAPAARSDVERECVDVDAEAAATLLSGRRRFAEELTHLSATHTQPLHMY